MKILMAALAVGLMMASSGCATTPGGVDERPATKAERCTFLHDGYTRAFTVYCPEACRNMSAVPLVIALHGGGGSAKRWPRYTNGGFERLVDAAPFILVYPDGLEHQWNDGREYPQSFAHQNRIDDLGYLSRLIDHLKGIYPVDPDRIFMTGASNGGIMSHYMAAMHSEQIAAIAPVIASISEKMLPQFNPSQPVSVLMINGKEDPLVRWEGGMIQLGEKKNGRVIPVEDAVKFWVEHNRCDPTPRTIDLPDRDPGDGTRITRTTYSGGRGGTEVVLVAITGGGHEWPTVEDKRGHLLKSMMDKVVGIRSRDMDACEVIWDFFRHHAREKASP